MQSAVFLHLTITFSTFNICAKQGRRSLLLNIIPALYFYSLFSKPLVLCKTNPWVLLHSQELKKLSAEKRLVLDTVNEVGSALLDLVPWQAREGLDRLVADANQRYRQADETITQRVQLVQAAIQRSQQVLQRIQRLTAKVP